MQELSRGSCREMWQNQVWATGYNVVAVPLAAGGAGFDRYRPVSALPAIPISASNVVLALNVQLLRRPNLNPGRVPMRNRRFPRVDGQRLPPAPLIILLPALIIGILAMHIWIGGHGTIATHSAAGHSAPVESIGQGTADGHPGHSEPEQYFSPDAAGPMPGQGVDSECGHGCGSMDMAMATCMLALVLLTLTLLLPSTAGPIRRHLLVWRPQPVLPRTTATPRTPSLVQLSISRT